MPRPQRHYSAPRPTHAEGREARTLTTRRGDTVETFYTDEEARSEFSVRVNNNSITGDFAASLNSQYEAGRRDLSDAQMVWVHLLLVKSDMVAANVETPDARIIREANVAGFEALNTLLATAGNSIQRPRIRFGADGDDGYELRRATRGNFVGQGIIVRGQRRDWVGRIDAEGNLVPGRNYREGGDHSARLPAIIESLRGLATDPARWAGERGRLIGACVFCGRTLTDHRSTTVGYGPICAAHYQLPWGEDGSIPTARTRSNLLRTSGRTQVATRVTAGPRGCNCGWRTPSEPAPCEECAG